jgi:hypothetical protein
MCGRSPLSNERLAVRVLNRLAYGPGPGDLETMHRIGVDAWIRQQLHPTRIPDSESGASRPSKVEEGYAAQT